MINFLEDSLIPEGFSHKNLGCLAVKGFHKLKLYKLPQDKSYS